MGVLLAALAVALWSPAAPAQPLDCWPAGLVRPASGPACAEALWPIDAVSPRRIARQPYQSTGTRAAALYERLRDASTRLERLSRETDVALAEIQDRLDTVRVSLLHLERPVVASPPPKVPDARQDWLLAGPLPLSSLPYEASRIGHVAAPPDRTDSLWTQAGLEARPQLINLVLQAAAVAFLATVLLVPLGLRVTAGSTPRV